jgi:hypothetical protein
MKPFNIFLNIVIFIAITLGLVACGSLTKEVKVDLPPYTAKLVVECYLEHGKPYRLLLTESISFLDAPATLPEVKDALITIKNDKKTISLTYKPTPDLNYSNEYTSDDIKNPILPKYYNYVASEIVDSTADGKYFLEITDTKGRKITAETKFMYKVPIKEYFWEFLDKDQTEKDPDSKASLLIRHFRPQGEEQFYRFSINVKKNDKWKTPSETDLYYRGIFATNNEATIGSRPNFKDKDTLLVRLYHTEETYYDYIRSVNQAASASGNPFANGGPIYLAVSGGLGIFTTLTYDEKQVIIKK